MVVGVLDEKNMDRSWQVLLRWMTSSAFAIS